MPKANQKHTDAERMIYQAIEEYGADRVLNAWISRQNQLARQRTPEYRAQQSAKQRERKMEAQHTIERLEAEVRRLKGKHKDADDDEEHAA